MSSISFIINMPPKAARTFAVNVQRDVEIHVHFSVTEAEAIALIVETVNGVRRLNQCVGNVSWAHGVWSPASSNSSSI